RGRVESRRFGIGFFAWFWCAVLLGFIGWRGFPQDLVLGRRGNLSRGDNFSLDFCWRLRGRFKRIRLALALCAFGLRNAQVAHGRFRHRLQVCAEIWLAVCNDFFVRSNSLAHLVLQFLGLLIEFFGPLFQGLFFASDALLPELFPSGCA